MKKLMMAAIGLMMAVSANAQYLNDPETPFYQGKFYLPSYCPFRNAIAPGDLGKRKLIDKMEKQSPTRGSAQPKQSLHKCFLCLLPKEHFLCRVYMCYCDMVNHITEHAVCILIFFAFLYHRHDS